MDHQAPKPRNKMCGFFLSKTTPSGVRRTTTQPAHSGPYGLGPSETAGAFLLEEAR